MVGIRILDVKSNEVIKKESENVKLGLNKVSKHYFSKLILGERKNVMMVLSGMFRRLRWEDIEEVYSDGCMVLWKKMNEKGFELKENSIRSYMIMICRNIGMHYLRGVRDDIYSLDEMMENSGKEVTKNDNECGMNDVFDVMDEENRYSENERYKKLDMVWDKLGEVDRMILESYYWEGCKMEDIAKRIGYKSGDSVKSKKSKVLKKIMEMMSEKNEKAADSLPFHFIPISHVTSTHQTQTHQTEPPQADQDLYLFAS